MTKFQTQRKSFTLIEMLVVVVIIGILAGVLVPRLVGARERASDSARIVKVGQISSAVELYAQEKGTTYPLAPLTTTGTSIARQDIADAISPYLTTIPTDPGKGTVAISTAPGNIQVTGDSFAYWTNTGGTVYAITALMESKKGNTTNATQTIDSDKQGGYQKVGKGLTTTIVVAGGGGGGSYAIVSGVTIYGTDIMVSDGTPANTYVIADKNAGATVAGTGVTSYGAFFQRGNNHPFSSTVNETITPNRTTQVSTIGLNTYTDGTWIYDPSFNLPRGDWSLNQNDDLRPAGGQGPCPSGYYLPTRTERQGLYNTWVKIYSGDAMYTSSKGNLFRDTLKLPMAGYRSYDSAESVLTLGDIGYYWSSTPNDAYAYGLYFGSSDVGAYGNADRALGFSVRCFKNSY